MTSPKAYEVRHVNRNEIKEFIETWHYSHSINGLSATHCFGLYYKNVLIGGMIYGRMAMKGQSVKYQDTQVRDAVKAGIITETDADMTKSAAHAPAFKHMVKRQDGKQDVKIL